VFESDLNEVKSDRFLYSNLRPIVHLLDDDSVSEIMCNPDGRWFTERRGKPYLISEDVNFSDPDYDGDYLMFKLSSIANVLRIPFDDNDCLFNAQLQDGSRIAATRPPITWPGCSLNIRRFSKVRYTLGNLIEYGTLSDDLASVLTNIIQSNQNVLISGSTGSGKTTLMDALSDYFDEHERIVVIEDTRELRIQAKNLVQMECRKNPLGDIKAFLFDQLLKQSLRMRPDRILLGEIRGEEALTFLDSLNTGHGGSMATTHASSPEDALRRVADLANRALGFTQIHTACGIAARSIQYVIQAKKIYGQRLITDVIRVTGYDPDRGNFSYDQIFKLPELPQHNSLAA